MQEDEDVNPNSYINNIGDCMLVLALGLLVALVTRYGVTLSSDQPSATSGEQVNLDQNNDGVIDNTYQKAGTVYYDSSTGEYYMVEQ